MASSLGGGARADYPSGGFRTRVTGGRGFSLGPRGGGPRGGGGGWLEPALRATAGQQYKLRAEQLRGAQLQNRALAGDIRAAERARGPQLRTRHSQVGIDNEMRRLALRQARAGTQISEAEAAAQRRAPPLRWNIATGATTAGAMPDVTRMSGAQRRAFLPQGSAFTGGPSPLETYAQTRAATAGQTAGELGGISRLRGMQLAGFVPGGGAGNWGWYGPQSPTGRAERQANIEDELELRRRQGAMRLFNPQYGGGA